MDERTKLRRNDRAAGEDWIRKFMHEAEVGVLATVHDGQPFVNSNIFVYDAGRHAIYLHTARAYRPITAGELKRTSVFRLDIESWSGKRKFVEPDFPGAYRYEDRGKLAAEAPD